MSHFPGELKEPISTQPRSKEEWIAILGEPLRVERGDRWIPPGGDGLTWDCFGVVLLLLQATQQLRFYSDFGAADTDDETCRVLKDAISNLNSLMQYLTCFTWPHCRWYAHRRRIATASVRRFRDKPPK